MRPAPILIILASKVLKMDHQKKAEFGWVMFDWANSSYSLVISTALFPVYFLDSSEKVIHFAGIDISNSSMYAYSVAFAYVLVCIASPLLSGIADFGGHRKLFMRLFTTLGSLACMSLFFFEGPQTQWIGIASFVVATSSHAGSLVFYDSYLSQLVPPERADHLSAKGYAFGYIGSVLLMCINIISIQKPEWFGIPDPQTSARIAFFSVGVWWLGFSQFSFLWLPSDPKNSRNGHWLHHGVEELKKAWNYTNKNPDLKRFLRAYFFYSAGVQTVIYLASSFAKEELHFRTSQLIIVILLLQLVAIGGAYLFANVSKRTNNLFALKLMILIWSFICLFAYFVYGEMEFYFLAAMVGLVLGGIQALSRSSYSKMIPKDHPDVTCFYSFYDVIYYISIVFGTFIFGSINQITNSMRFSVLALMIFFVIGYLFIRPLSPSAIRNNS